METGAWREGVKYAVCEANAYLRNGDQEELVLEAVDKVRPFDDGLLLEDIFGRRKFLRAKIKELALVDHKIILERE
ncbi:CooT family nickel-binding protein [Desulfothermobacter acidiphilus]|uniref:CooT family nickel-binding protein n=1 Tax=Desulfothermobacter acidiphilus TaxID=1938353 RepID=UPI003F8C5343